MGFKSQVPLVPTWISILLHKTVYCLLSLYQMWYRYLMTLYRYNATKISEAQFVLKLFGFLRMLSKANFQFGFPQPKDSEMFFSFERRKQTWSWKFAQDRFTSFNSFCWIGPILRHRGSPKSKASHKLQFLEICFLWIFPNLLQGQKKLYDRVACLKGPV